MAKVELKGFFEKIEKEKNVGARGVRLQNVLFRIPGYDDGFGKKSDDELWQLTVFGDRIDKFDLAEKAAVNPKAILEVYINSKTWYKEGDPADEEHAQYSLYAVLAGVKHVD